MTTRATMVRRSLLDGDDDEAAEEEKGSPPRLGFNEQYAKRFEYNKRREDLHRLQELKKKGLDKDDGDDDNEESSEEEEDDDGLLAAPTEERIFETLVKIKSRDPSIYSTETKFFEGEDGNDEEEEEEGVAQGEEARTGRKIGSRKQKPLYLKDVNARQLLAGGVEEEEEEEEGGRKPGYFQEQDELKRAFLEGVRDAEASDEYDADLLTVKKKSKEELERDAQDAAEAVKDAERRARDQKVDKRLEEYFGKDDELDEKEKFLKDYLLNKGWIDQKQKPSYPSYADQFEDVSEDEEDLDKQDKFEKDYNFRYEENPVDRGQVKVQPRFIGDSVRKKPETRKKQRQNKKERESEAEQARREELKRLKNVKKKEVMEKLSKVRAIAGIREAQLDAAAFLREDDLEEDFDPGEYDKKMKDAFGEDYYGAEDPDFAGSDGDENKVGKPDFDAEDEILGFPTERAGFAAVKSKLDGQSSAQPEKKKNVKVSFEEKLLIDKHLDEYYKLDYEDVVGDLKTRFRYREVKPNKYGLKTKDILGLDDKELNQFVSLKKLVPYATQEWEARRPVPRLNSKHRRKNALKLEGIPSKGIPSKGTPSKGLQIISDGIEGESVDDKPNARQSHLENGGTTDVGEGGDGGVSGLKKKRKRRKAGPLSGISKSRLLSYEPRKKDKDSKGKMKKKAKT